MTSSPDTWYFVANGEGKEGPVSREALLALRSTGRIGENTWVWSPGMADWEPFGRVFPSSSPSETPPLFIGEKPETPREPSAGSPPPAGPVPSGGNIDQSRRFFGGIHHPWRRFFARMLDIFVYVLFISLAMMIFILFMRDVAVPILQNLLPVERAIAILALALWIPTEALLLSVSGNTPGKWLFGISVRTASGHRLSFGRSLKRSFLVTVQGLGLYLPIVSIVTEWFAYRRLTKTGTTLWDTSAGTVVTHKTWGTARAIACVATILIVFVLPCLISLIALALACRG